MGSRPSNLCRRTIEYVSRELDDDLAEFEQAFLRAHVRTCATCATVRRQLVEQTAALRGAPLEPISRPVALPSHPSVLRRLMPAAAAAVVAVVGAGGLVNALRSGPATQRALAAPAPSIEHRDMILRQHRVDLMNANMPRSRAADAIPDVGARYGRP